MLWYLRLDFAAAQPSRIGAEYVDCTSRIGAEWGAEFAELPSIIRRGLVDFDTVAMAIIDIEGLLL